MGRQGVKSLRGGGRPPPPPKSAPACGEIFCGEFTLNSILQNRYFDDAHDEIFAESQEFGLQIQIK